MTILTAAIDWNPAVPTPAAAPAGPAEAFLALVQSMAPFGIWRLNDNSPTAITDLTGRAPGQWVAGDPGLLRPTLVDGDASGFSTDLHPQVRASIPYHADHVTASGGVFVVTQFRDVVAKQAIVNRFEDDGGDGTGRWLVELTSDGTLTMKLHQGTIAASSPSGTVVKGVPTGVAMTWGAAGLKLYSNSGTPVASLPGQTGGAAGVRPISLGAWYAGSDWFSGLLGWLVYFSSQPSDAAIGLLMDEVKATGILRASDDVSTVQVSQSVVIDALANDLYQGAKAAAAINITAQGSLGSYSVQGDKNVSYTAAGVAGNDLSGMYTVNGSAAATLNVIVTSGPPPPSTGNPLPRSRSGLSWSLCAHNHLADIEEITATRELDQISDFSKKPGSGVWSVMHKMTRVGEMTAEDEHIWIATNGTPSLNIAFRAFPTDTVGGTLPGAWPSRSYNEADSNAFGKIAGDELIWISPTYPPGINFGLSTEQKRLAMVEVWKRASLGWFDYIWRTILTRLLAQTIVPYALHQAGKAVVFRPFWEGNDSSAYGSSQSIRAHNYVMCQTATEVAYARTAMEKFNTILFDVFKPANGFDGYVGSHFNPLKGGSTIASVLDYMPSNCQFLGPDHYNRSPIIPTQQSWAVATLEERGNGQPIGIQRWINACIAANKLLGVGESGIYTTDGDNEEYFDGMMQTLADNPTRIGYYSFFNYSAHRLTLGVRNPLSAQKVRDFLGV